MINRRILVAGFLIFMLALVLPACSSDSDDESDTGNPPTEGIAKDITWQEYSSVGQSFSVQLPSGWEVQEEGLSFVSVSSPEENVTFSVTLDRGIGDYALDQYSDLWYTAGAFGDSYQKISSGKLSLAGSVPAREFTEQWSEENLMIKGTEVFFVSKGIGGKVYTESPLEQYDAYKPVFDYIIQSLQLSDKASSEVAWETHTNDDYGFSVNLPFDWWIEASEEEAVVYIHSPGHTACGTLLIVNSEGKSLDERVDTSIASFEAKYEKSEVVSDRKISINGVEAREIVSIMNDGSGESKVKGVGLISGELYYITSFSGWTGGVYEFYEPVWDEILSSFTIVEGPPSNFLLPDETPPCGGWWCEPITVHPRGVPF